MVQPKKGKEKDLDKDLHYSPLLEVFSDLFDMGT